MCVIHLLKYKRDVINVINFITNLIKLVTSYSYVYAKFLFPYNNDYHNTWTLSVSAGAL